MSTMTHTDPILDLPLPPPREVVRITVDRYDQMVASGAIDEDDPIELLNGIMVWKMAKNPPHSTASGKTARSIGRLVPRGWHVRKEEPVRIPDYDEPEPDVAVVRGDYDDYQLRHPAPEDLALLVEVAESSLQRDHGEKRLIYARARIPFYWIVNLIDRQAECYSGPVGADYAERTILSAEESLPLVIEGQTVGVIPVADLLPKP